MNISLVHTFEVITFLLVIGKIYQVRKLYRQSNTQKISAKKLTRKVQKPRSVPKKESKRLDTKATSQLFKRLKQNYSHYGLPLAEVSFTEGLPLPEVSYSSDDTNLDFSNEKPESKHKSILNSYIEDFFFESAPKLAHEAEVVQFKSYMTDSLPEDEFITVADEHDEMIRAFDSLEKSACLAR